MNFFDGIRESWEKLSDRERRMLSIMGGVLLTMLAFVVVWTTTTALAEVEEERDAIRSVLSDIDRAGVVLDKREAERKAIEQRYKNRAPALAAYVESKAKEESLEVRQVVEDPEKVVGGYRRQSVRVSFSGVSLRPIMHLLASIDDERSPIAVERILIEHYSQGDSYKVDLGIASYEPVAKKSEAKPAGEVKPAGAAP
ncbi:MAG: type II secretion system protein GspM [Myxococcales bacterium]